MWLIATGAVKRRSNDERTIKKRSLKIQINRFSLFAFNVADFFFRFALCCLLSLVTKSQDVFLSFNKCVSVIYRGKVAANGIWFIKIDMLKSFTLKKTAQIAKANKSEIKSLIPLKSARLDLFVSFYSPNFSSFAAAAPEIYHFFLNKTVSVWLDIFLFAVCGQYTDW